ncbi:MAG: response regulator transcription factor [Saprospiraceae bacterium]
MTILICEHEEIMLTAIEFRMRKAGFKVVRAKNGKEAEERIAEDKPGFIVTDLVLPNTDVLGLIDMVRSKQKSDVPIIMITDLDHADEVILEGFKLGANDFVTKPFKPTELILRIKRIFQDRGIIVEREKIS